MHHKRNPIWLGVAIFLVCCLVACGGGGGGSKTGDQPKGGSATGRTIEAGDVTITMNSASFSSYKVTANFTVVNNGGNELALDPETAFAIEGAAGERAVELVLDPLACRANPLAGAVPAGGERTGDVCWKADATKTWPRTAKITYSGAPEGAAWEVQVE